MANARHRIYVTIAVFFGTNRRLRPVRKACPTRPDFILNVRGGGDCAIC